MVNTDFILGGLLTLDNEIHSNLSNYNQTNVLIFLTTIQENCPSGVLAHNLIFPKYVHLFYSLSHLNLTAVFKDGNTKLSHIILDYLQAYNAKIRT